ncbi:MAG TPA: single-stranded DNA-binding protein [Acidimicrobiales bacterium]|jgi:single-strand DNA-binding protein|nr:single-stranded DNA-binding protein [Actinomycetota bacterium]MDP6281128.1 single-stranded DNA-binding protein [Acidimicrobiales bacterium]MDP7116885.1 single-stranded DNA-binding protein [Acidimicrobiales bacterium]MDP7411217.1 single-stranded DNA-binding protein [Acidimicrobiales bacterium]MEE1523043.1 single-stranded DNA-binding protein [Acidimicrobiales bacterium]|tara:strand:- start:95 stop:532 length:438 start_codon:yes stop_codon:yes gene_type:complete
MAFDNTVTLVGNITRDPELRFTPAGIAVASFGLAWNRKNRDGEESVSFFDVTCWRDLAENVAESLSKGNRVVVYGRLDQQSWENDNGERRSKVEVIADEVAPSLRWATAEVTRTEFRGEAGSSVVSGGGQAPSQAPTHSTDEEPF